MAIGRRRTPKPKPGDVLMEELKDFPIKFNNYKFYHYIVYLGDIYKTGKLMYAECTAWVDITLYSHDEFLNRHTWQEIRKFQGTEIQRSNAVKKAIQMAKSKEYHYHAIDFNCETFANIVQYGKKESKQSEYVINRGLVFLAEFVINNLFNNKTNV